MIIEGNLTDTSYAKLLKDGYKIYKLSGKKVRELRWGKWNILWITIIIEKTNEAAQAKFDELKNNAINFLEVK